VDEKLAKSSLTECCRLAGQHGRVSLAIVSMLLLASCSSSDSKSPSQNAGALANALSPQITPTYDGSGQVVEPSILFFPSGWNGFQYWLDVTPYPHSDETKENPSILVSDDGSSWKVPPGLTNPIALPISGNFDDGELFHDAVSNQLWVYYLWEGDASRTHILRKESSDGVHWGQAQDLFDVSNYTLFSPTVDKVGSTYHMWSVNTGTVGCGAATTTVESRTSADGANWSAPQVVSISQPGYVIWHIEARYIPSKQEYWMFAAAYPQGTNCNNDNMALFFNSSLDGQNWTSYPRPALEAGSRWDDGEIYRSTFVYDPAQDLLKVWYSARSGVWPWKWHTGLTSAKFTQFLSSLQNQVTPPTSTSP
jgi:hypothetical protein